MEGDGADAAPAATVAAEIAAAGGVAIADRQRRLDDRRRPGARRRDGRASSGGSTSWSTARASSAGRACPKPTPTTSRSHFAVHVGGLVQHRPRRVAAHGRTGLRPHRHDDRRRALLGTDRQPRRGAGSSGSRAALAAEGADAQHPGQARPARTRWREWRADPADETAELDAADAPTRWRRSWSPDGRRRPRPRGLPGQRRGLRRGRRPLRAIFLAIDRGLRRAVASAPTVEDDRAAHWLSINDETRLLRTRRP